MRIAPRLLLTIFVAGAAPAVTEVRASEPTAEMQKARKSFRDVAEKVFDRLLHEMPETERRGMLEALSCSEKELAGKMADMLMEMKRDAFRLTREEAERLVARKFDDRANKSRARRAAAALEESGVPLPELLKHLIETARDGSARGIELEFARRVLEFHAGVLLKALGEG